MQAEAKTIGLIGKFADSSTRDTLQTVHDMLTAQGRKVLLDSHTAEVIPDLAIDSVDRDTLGKQCDLIIVVGGDGTFLNAARSLVEHDVPLLGINLGRLGFLADISRDEIHTTLQKMLDGDFVEERRFMLHASIQCEDIENSESFAFNDVVVHKWNVARMIELDIYINGQYMNTLRSDGLIISTPTGSTAYALSGGGPIVHPSLDAIILVPICPHTMSQRPIVVDGSSEIEVVISNMNQAEAQVTCDGQQNINIKCGDSVMVKKFAKPLRMHHPSTYDYYEILRAKLHWGHKLS